MKRDLVAVTFALIFPGAMTWLYFVAAAGEGTQPNTAVLIAYFTGKFVQFGFPALYVGLTDPRSLAPRSPRWRDMTLGLFFGLAVGAAALALYHVFLKDAEFFHVAGAKVVDKLGQSGLKSVQGFVALACFYTVIHSLLEEYYWRWFVFGWLARHLRFATAMALASLGFMAHHVIVLAVYFPGWRQIVTLALPFSVAVGVGGAVWCWIYYRTGSLYATWLSHALIDAAIMLIGYDMVADLLASP